MSYRLIDLKFNDLDKLMEFATVVYQDAANDKYPEFRFFSQTDNAGKQRKFYGAFTLSDSFIGHNIRQAFALVDEHGDYVMAVGVTRYYILPIWSISWVLSRKQGFGFITSFREMVKKLADFHESIGINEFFVSYPSSREAAYSKIMLPFREKYYTFVQCTVPAKQRSPYRFIHNVMGQNLYSYDMNLRRYILRRPNTEPPSQGGIATRTP